MGTLSSLPNPLRPRSLLPKLVLMPQRPLAVHSLANVASSYGCKGFESRPPATLGSLSLKSSSGNQVLA